MMKTTTPSTITSYTGLQKYTSFDPSSASAWNQLRGIIQRVANEILDDIEIEQKKNSFKNQVSGFRHSPSPI